jgi:predicted PurR-regulated permease PerM
MPPVRDARTIFLGILCLIAVLACLYVAQDIVVPVVLALVLKLLLQPLVSLLERLHVPRPAGALIALAVLLSVFVGLGMLLSSPAAQWVSQLPQTWPQLQQQFAFLREPVEHVQHTFDQMGIRLGTPTSVLSYPIGMATAVLGGTGTVAAHLLETLLVLFYLLVFGETFLRRFVEVLPRFAEKREAVEITLRVERDLSAYLLTITVINTAVGCATAGVMWLCDVPGPVLWGVVAFCLNFVPILGPFCGIVLFLAVGLISKGPAWAALLPAALYFGIHVMEGEIITPMLLANRFTINPVAVILSRSSGTGCGAFLGRSWQCPCWRSSSSFAIGCGRAALSVISWKGSRPPAILVQGGEPRGGGSTSRGDLQVSKSPANTRRFG